MWALVFARAPALRRESAPKGKPHGGKRRRWHAVGVEIGAGVGVEVAVGTNGWRPRSGAYEVGIGVSVGVAVGVGVGVTVGIAVGVAVGVVVGLGVGVRGGVRVGVCVGLGVRVAIDLGVGTWRLMSSSITVSTTGSGPITPGLSLALPCTDTLPRIHRRETGWGGQTRDEGPGFGLART